MVGILCSNMNACSYPLITDLVNYGAWDLYYDWCLPRWKESIYKRVQALYMQGCKLVYKFVVDSLLLHCKGPFCKLSCTQRLVQSLHTILERCLSCCEVGSWWSWTAYGCASIAYSDIRKHGLQMQGFIATPFDHYSLLEIKKFTYESCSSYKFSIRAA